MKKLFLLVAMFAVMVSPFSAFAGSNTMPPKPPVYGKVGCQADGTFTLVTYTLHGVTYTVKLPHYKCY